MMAEQASICFSSEPFSQSFHCCEYCAAAGSKFANMKVGTTIAFNTRIHVFLRMREEYQSAYRSSHLIKRNAGSARCVGSCDPKDRTRLRQCSTSPILRADRSLR